MQKSPKRPITSHALSRLYTHAMLWLHIWTALLNFLQQQKKTTKNKTKRLEHFWESEMSAHTSSLTRTAFPRSPLIIVDRQLWDVLAALNKCERVLFFIISFGRRTQKHTRAHKKVFTVCTWRPLFNLHNMAPCDWSFKVGREKKIWNHFTCNQKHNQKLAMHQCVRESPITWYRYGLRQASQKTEMFYVNCWLCSFMKIDIDTKWR